MFLASIKSEEGAFVNCSVSFVDPTNTLPDPPALMRAPHWQFVPFDRPVAYDVSSLVKLAIGADAATTSLAVYPDKKGMLQIWGLFDQQGGFQSYVQHEPTLFSCPPPGALQCQAIAPGHIIVTNGYLILAELNGGILTETSLDLFTSSAIRDKLLEPARQCISVAEHSAQADNYAMTDTIRDAAINKWFAIVSRLLLRVREYGHGGALVFCGATSHDESIQCKYNIAYDRIPQLFTQWVTLQMQSAQEWNRAWVFDDISSNRITAFMASHTTDSEIADNEQALTGAIRFIASLSRVDGLVLLNKLLLVRGFGGVIRNSDTRLLPVFHASTPRPVRKGSKAFDMSKHGTRHGSMIRYCSYSESAVGFVISTDGPVRAVTRIGERVYVWDNIRLGVSEDAGL